MFNFLVLIDKFYLSIFFNHSFLFEKKIIIFCLLFAIKKNKRATKKYAKFKFSLINFYLYIQWLFIAFLDLSTSKNKINSRLI